MPTQNSLAGCVNSQAVPSDYIGPIFKDDTTGYCYPYGHDGTVQYYPQYGYNPKLGTGIAFSVIFGLLMLLHIAFTITSKRKWLIVAAIGAAGELAGWIGRALSGTDNTASDAADSYFLDQIICLTIAPVFFSATCYCLFVVLVNKLNPTISRFRPHLLTYVFVSFDVISLVLQAVGGGLAASATTQHEDQIGTHIFLAGIVFQLAVMLVFSAIAIDYFYRLKKVTPLGEKMLPGGYLYCVYGLALASFMIILRGGYRSAELGEGWEGFLIRNEGFFLGLDAVAKILCLVSLAVFHPLFTLPRPSEEAANELSITAKGE